MNNWNLDKLYLGLDDTAFSSDIATLEKEIATLASLAQTLDKTKPVEGIKDFLAAYEAMQLRAIKLLSFLSLSLSTDSTNQTLTNAMVKIQQKVVQTTLPLTLFERFVSNVSDLENVVNEDELLKEYSFMLLEIKENSIHLLSDQEEVLAAELNQSGGSLYTKMQGVLTSTLKVAYRDEVITLPQVRNLAYSGEADVRRDAYFAELESYKKIEQPVAFALNGIKKEVLTMSKKRNFASPLEQTLINSRINQDVLDSLIQAMNEYLPEFRNYLKQKAKVLGHENGLPFYDMFAPMGESSKKYTVEEAQQFILKNFSTFSDDLHDLAKRAFDEEWIDYFPKAGKAGGAFCSRLYPIKESRILANFDGGIGDICTLAHELGHAYHNHVVFEERLFNTSYPMPIAETASILCETIVKRAALKESKSAEEKLGLLEQELQDSTQVIVDILSRYLFETNVFARAQGEFLNETTLNEMMIEAQKATYGDGLNPEYLNQGMWINKGHYYSTGRSFYNFPYAFGLLFAKGIYAKFTEQGPSFVDEIKTLLRMTGKATLMDVAKSINIDITKVEFWRSSLEVIKEDIELFLELTK